MTIIRNSLVLRNRYYLSELMKVHKTEIIFLQEIWLQYHDEAKLKNIFPDFNFLISTPICLLIAKTNYPPQARSGTALLYVGTIA